jgi:hypothetical protein
MRMQAFAPAGGQCHHRRCGRQECHGEAFCLLHEFFWLLKAAACLAHSTAVPQKFPAMQGKL